MVPSLIVDLGEFSGPLDLLLNLAREHRIDLTRLPLANLADQYLAFIRRVRDADLSIAAEYLVMAAWLTWLKSRLLLPPDECEDEPVEDIAKNLAARLRQMDAIRKAATKLDDLAQLGRDVFPRPQAHVPVDTHILPLDNLYDLLRAYASGAGRAAKVTFAPRTYRLHDPVHVIHHLIAQLGGKKNWQSIHQLLPRLSGDAIRDRSAIAATFVAALELSRRGVIELRQKTLNDPLFLRHTGRKSS